MEKIYFDFKSKSYYQKIIKIKNMFLIIRIIMTILIYLIFMNKKQIAFPIILIVFIELLIENLENIVIIKINKLDLSFKLLLESFNQGGKNILLREFEMLDRNMLFDLVVKYKIDEENKIVFLIDQFQKKNDMYIKITFVSLLTTILGIYSFIVIPDTMEEAVNILLGISGILFMGILVSKILKKMRKSSLNNERFKSYYIRMLSEIYLEI